MFDLQEHRPPVALMPQEAESREHFGVMEVKKGETIKFNKQYLMTNPTFCFIDFIIVLQLFRETQCKNVLLVFKRC